MAFGDGSICHMTDSKIINSSIWHDDVLGRQEDAKRIITFLTRRVEERLAAKQSGSYVLNIDAGWGHGKTFFLTRLRQELEQQDYLVAYVNAWEDDHATDPLIPIVSAIDGLFRSKFKGKSSATTALKNIKASGAKIVSSGAKHLAIAAGKRWLGEEGLLELKTIAGASATEIAEATKTSFEKAVEIQTEALLEKFNESKNSIEVFRNSLGTLVRAQAEPRPVFILVDELDRCRPSYAIELLERTKHLFSIDRVIFVFATDTGQLQHAIAAVYGAKFDGARYLLRFFDRTYAFAAPSLEQFCSQLFTRFPLPEEIMSSPPKDDHAAFFIAAATSFRSKGSELSLRCVEQSYDILRNILTLWPFKAKAELIYLLPLIFSFQQRDLELFELISERNSDALSKVYPTRGKGKLSFHRRTSYDPIKPQLADLNEVLKEFVSTTRQSLPSLFRGNSTRDGLTYWVWMRFQDEYQREHSMTHRHGQEPHSVIFEYPNLVRGAGRLSKASFEETD